MKRPRTRGLFIFVLVQPSEASARWWNARRPALRLDVREGRSTEREEETLVAIPAAGVASPACPVRGRHFRKREVAAALRECAGAGTRIRGGALADDRLVEVECLREGPVGIEGEVAPRDAICGGSVREVRVG